jgi:serine/threonine-protein kinase
MGLATVIVVVGAATSGSDSALAGSGYLMALLPFATGPIAFLLGLIALLSPVTAQTLKGRQHATIAVATGLATGLLCCVIFVVGGGNS